jgi:predicted CXXCH cytochrome family protein
MRAMIGRITFLTAVILVASIGHPGAAASGDDEIARHRRGITGTAHDFSELFGGPGGMCAACHVPHVQAVAPTTQPATQPAVEMFLLGGQRRVFVPNRYMPGPTSLICLGCHDGTVATSTISASHEMLAGIREGFAVPQGFVWRDHPIGVAYPDQEAGYRPRSFVLGGGKIRLPEGRIECVSCHDPHDLSGVPKMLVMSNRRSALCLACHIK